MSDHSHIGLEERVLLTESLWDRVSAIFGDDQDARELIYALILRKEIIPELTNQRLLGMFLGESYTGYEDLVAFMGRKKWSNDLPQERIIKMFLRNAREPKRCPRCGELIGGAVNEIWVD